ncbi:ChaN family lipoprotein [Parendozoicomonas haliclonae]|uniref:Haem-binding uptake Tiki superfamily ChaN domain-containing protein n=1 Tax=Parendozoicomonas haliclonae TaxID=1960125 RepID=A0A1X7AIC4_9GAMM|nr:ChaN family lipoprotein [Parendozoicomonas haliclonae]SMA44846.1 hypothetical protein EHSB41UT_01811 [Parendozoicomonas haliclonae]
MTTAALVLSGCAAKPAVMFATDSQPEHSIGTVSELADQLQKADYVILGERHDNPEHHALQKEVLVELYKRGWLKQVAMEMLVPSQQPGADLAVKDRVSDLTELNTMLSWEKGWDWELYGPIVSWATSNGVPLKSANLDKGELVTARANPARLGNLLLGEEGVKMHKDQFKAAHCGSIPADRAETMLRVQVGRDVRMAASLTEMKGTVLLAGSWHARKDIGVPRYVLANDPDAKILALGFTESTEVEASNSQQYDIVWATAGVERPDYCAMFKNGTMSKGVVSKKAKAPEQAETAQP